VSLEWLEKFLIFDRGSLDGLAYWPSRQELFFRENQTNPEAEFSRYNVVIHLEVAQQEDYNSDHSDVRLESHERALQIDERINEVWKEHPCRFIFHNNTNFVDKIAKVHTLIEKIITNQSVPLNYG
jgi:hypothetical protein